MDGMTHVLFLDDMGWRHSEFTRITDRIDGVQVWQAQTANGAITFLGANEFDQVFLDHDLSEEDIMIKVGEDGRVPTGMTVVDYILTMENPPPHIIVHSCNGPARDEMVKRLQSHPKAGRVEGVPFPELMSRLRAKYG